MGTKYLARTAIEGGRAKHCRYEEWQSTRSERAQSRVMLRRAAVDPEFADEVVIDRRWQDWDLDFDDKLNPVKRWLDAQVGRRWDDVYSEIKKRFDSRSTAGRHILYDHLLRWVGQWSDHDAHIHEHTVDPDGILCKGPYFRRHWYRKPKHEPKRAYKAPTAKQLAAFFVGGRNVHSDRYVWYVPTRVKGSIWERCDGSSFCKHPTWKHKSEFEIQSWSKNKYVRTYHLCEYFFYRQGRDMTEKEIAYWDTLTWNIRSEYTYREDAYDNDRKNRPYF